MKEIKNVNFTQIRNFSSAKRQYQGNEKTSYRLGERFTRNTSQKELLSKIYKELLNFNNKRINKLMSTKFLCTKVYSSFIYNFQNLKAANNLLWVNGYIPDNRTLPGALKK